MTCSLAFGSRVGSIGAALIEIEWNPNEIRIGPRRYAMGSGVVIRLFLEGVSAPLSKEAGPAPPCRRRLFLTGELQSREGMDTYTS